MYADDTNITTTGRSIREIFTLANKDLHKISEWLKANKLSLIVTKTEHMFTGSDLNLDKVKNIPSLYFDSRPIKKLG